MQQAASIHDARLLVDEHHFDGAFVDVWLEDGSGLDFYAWLCEQALGERPTEVRLLFLSPPEVITAYPSNQSIAYLPKRAAAVFHAIERSCTTGDFPSRPGPLCGGCAYRRWCPSFGGDPARAAAEAPLAYPVVRRAQPAPASPIASVLAAS